MINEILSRLNADQGGKVELYNMEPSYVDLHGWYLTRGDGDVIANLPDVKLEPGGFIAVDTASINHLGDRLGLYDSARVNRDLVAYPGGKSHEGKCYSRLPDGMQNWEWLNPSWGRSNIQNF